MTKRILLILILALSLTAAAFSYMVTERPTRYWWTGDPVHDSGWNTIIGCHYGTASNRGPSPLIWENCPVIELTMSPEKGWIYFNDFINNPTLAANSSVYTNAIVGAWTGATAGTLTSTTDEPTGVLKLFTTTDNECTGIVVCCSDGVSGQAIFNATTPKAFYLEARLKCINITDTKFGVFFGLGEEALTGATGVIADDGTLTDKDLVGFHKLEADGDKFDTRHNTAGGGGVSTVKADAVTIVADTYLKLGMKLDTGDKTLTFYKDGVALANTVELDATNFPDGEELSVYLVVKAASADDAYVEIDWIRAALLY